MLFYSGGAEYARPRFLPRVPDTLLLRLRDEWKMAIVILVGYAKDREAASFVLAGGLRLKVLVVNVPCSCRTRSDVIDRGTE